MEKKSPKSSNEMLSVCSKMREEKGRERERERERDDGENDVKQTVSLLKWSYK